MTNSTCDCSDDGSGFAVPVPFNFIMIVILISLSAMFSGLTLGLLSLDKIGLQIVIGGDDPVLAKYAKAIMPVRANGNLLLCTLLLGNVAVNALLAILMADMTSGIIGFLISTVLIVIFGEIIPQASCSRHSLLVGYYTLSLTKFFIFVFFIAAYPLGYILDLVLGDDLGTIHSKRELDTLLALHVEHGAVDIESGNMMHGALKYKDMTVQQVMTPAKDVFMINIRDNLDYNVLKTIFRSGFSRIPVFDKDRNDIVGILLTKDLLLIDPKDEIPIRNFLELFGRQVVVTWPDQKLGEILALFSSSHRHMGIVRDVNNSGKGDPFYEVLGIVTLEDIVEEILGQEIEDETDGADEEDQVKRRDRDVAMIALLSGKSATDVLAEQEIHAISSHLMNNVPDFKVACSTITQGAVADVTGLKAVLHHVLVISSTRKSSDDELAGRQPVAEDVLYRRNEISNRCILILSGKIVIYAGKDQFRSELGPWALLGVDALSLDGKFSPDFSAYILSEKVRYLILTVKDFQKRKKHARRSHTGSGDNIAESQSISQQRSDFNSHSGVCNTSNGRVSEEAIELTELVGSADGGREIGYVAVNDSDIDRRVGDLTDPA